MKKLLLLSLLFCLSYVSIKAQTEVLCPQILEIVRIEDEINIPIVTDNGDGTVSLEFADNAVNQIFENFSVYNFERTFPSATTPSLAQLYTISIDTKDLLIAISDNISPAIIEVENDYSDLPEIDQMFIDGLDENEFKLSKYREINEKSGCKPCPLYDVPDGFELNLKFSYDAINDVFLVTMPFDTPCGNNITFTLKSLQEDNGYNYNFQLWEYDSSFTAPQANYDDDCFAIEDRLYTILSMSCSGPSDVGFRLEYYPSENQFIMIVQTPIFAEYRYLFSDITLGVSDIQKSNIFLFQNRSLDQLVVNDPNNEVSEIRIFNLKGKLLKQQHIGANKIIEASSLIKNKIYLTEFSLVDGRAFIKKVILK